MNRVYITVLTLALPLLSYAQEAPSSQPASAPASAPAEAKPQPTTAPTTVEATAEEPKKEEKKKEEEKLPKDLAVGLAGRVGIHGLIQGWYDSNTAADKFDAEPEGTFRIRRAEIKIQGDIIPKKFSFVAMTDLAKGLFKAKNTTVVTGVTDTDGDGIID